jgi:hypothetical protein
MRRTSLPLLLLLAPTALLAQLPSPSARALGMGGAYSLNARGFEAPAWNPAVLGMPGRPSLTFGLPQGQLEFGSNAFGFGDFTHYARKTLTTQDKVDLLAKVDTSLDVRTLFGASPIGLSIGRFAVSIGTAGDVSAGLGKDAVDLALFGNASRSGAGEFFTAAGSRGSGWAATTLAASLGWPFRLPIGRLAAGVTVKKVWGHGLGRASELSSNFQVNPAFQVLAAGHAIYTDYPDNFQVSGPGDILGGTGSPGSGYGVDVGGVLELPGGLTVGAVLVNAVGSMSWSTDRLTYERATFQVQQPAGGGAPTDTKTDSILVGSQIDTDPVARAFRDSLLARSNFARVLRAGATLRFGGLLLAADAQLRLTAGLDRQPSQYVAAGAEYVVLGFLPLRAGIGTDFAKTVTFSAGTGLSLGFFHLDVGVADATGSTNPGVRVGAGMGLMFGGGRSH